MSPIKYTPVELSVGVEAALGSLKRAVKRDGYQMQANLLLTSERTGDEKSVVWRDGEWREQVETEDEDG